MRTTAPLDKETIIESAKKTSRAIVIDEGYERYGVTAEIASVIADGAFYYLDAPVKRMGANGRAVPFSPVLEDQTVPTPEAVAEVAKHCATSDEQILFQQFQSSSGSSRSQKPIRSNDWNYWND